MDGQLQRDSAFYYSVCILKYLLKNGLINTEQYKKIIKINANYYKTKIIVL